MSYRAVDGVNSSETEKGRMKKSDDAGAEKAIYTYVFDVIIGCV